MSPSTVIDDKDKEELLETLVDRASGDHPQVERVRQLCCSCGGLISKRFRRDLWPSIIDPSFERGAAIESYRVPS